MDQKLTLLSKVPLFADLSASDLAAVGRLTDEVSVPAGKVLATEGSSGHEFFVILDGTVTITRGSQHLADLGGGDFFGELAMIANVPRTATATATTPTTLLVLGHREFTSLLADQPRIRDKVMIAVARRLSELAPAHTN
ncbi:MAG TPA: cyclic nucleotide-binding domain-containing protein [Candidatus Limnocylindrales bacterium]|nr:cyclic nucleotide-binding domain-containing protein [Candidatus Limnocylindrales bacterium]